MVSIDPGFFYKALFPSITGNFYAEVDDCIQSLRTIAEESDADLFRLVIFHDPANENENSERENYTKKFLQKTFQDKCPTFVLVSHSPEFPYAVSTEAGFLRKGRIRTFFRELGDNHYVVLEWPGNRELWASGLSSKYSVKSCEESAVGAFESVKAILDAENMGFNHIVRQWNYIGKILQDNAISNIQTKNYQIFNEVRHRYYQQFLTAKGFPAATGIGIKLNQVILDICANQPDNQDLTTYAIHNPNQVNPYQYGQQVLEGSPILSQPVKHPPEFERAKLVIMHDHIRLFISGTAAIIGQETVGIGDVEKQTQCTISNIEKLTDRDNIRRSYPMLPAGSFVYEYLRVYVKNKSDVKVTRSICEQRFPNIPVSYIVADICRDELLMEIEGEMIFCPGNEA